MDRRQALAGLTALAACAAIEGCTKRAEGPITIGGILPLTGDGGAFGVAASKGADLAIRLLNADIGRAAFAWKVEDSMGEPVAALNAARKLLDFDHASAFVGDVTSGGTHAVVPLLREAKRPLISPAASDPKLSGISPFFARVWPSDVFEAGIIADHARLRGFERIATVYSNDDYGTSFHAAFASGMGADKLALDLAFPKTIADFRPIVERILAANCDSILLVSLPEKASLFLQQLAVRNRRIPILATGSIEDPAILKLPNVSSITFASPAPTEADSIMRARFLDAYRTTFKEEPAVLADTGFDCALLLGKAILSAEEPQAQMAWIRSLRSFDGASGKLSFNNNGDVQKPYRLKAGSAAGFRFVDGV